MAPYVLALLASVAFAEPQAQTPRLIPPVLPASTVQKFETADSTPTLSGLKALGQKPEDFGDDNNEDPKKKKKRGLRILGVELSGDRDKPDNHEPYNDKSLESALDWDIKARVAFDGLGARAKHRNPNGVRSFQLSVLKYFDLPNAIGLGNARDGLYKSVGATPDKEIGGIELGVSGALNEYVGGSTIYDSRSHVNGDRAVGKHSLGVQAGWSPLGDNPGKPWNYTILAGASYEQRAVYAPNWNVDREGLGLMAGIAYQRAMQDVVPWMRRVKARTWLDGSAVRSFAANAAAELTVNLSDSVGVTGGATMRYTPSPEKGNPEEKTLDFGGIVGLDLSY